MSIQRFADLAAGIRSRPPRCGSVRLVAIDGHGGAGKSVFADRLSRALGGAPVAHTDDFASWENPLNWWPDLEAGLLRPLGRGETARYRAYDWARKAPGPRREVPPAEVVILEGVSAGRQAATDRLSYLVWVEAPLDVRLARGIERDGPTTLAAWQEWAAEEDVHFGIDRTRDRADLLVDGTPTVVHDPATTFVRIARRPTVTRS